MPLKRNYLALVVAVAAVPIGGCDTQVPQTVSGSLATPDGPAANQSLRLYDSFRTCEGHFVEARTNEAGEFRFHTSSTKGGISEVTQSLALCAERDGKWRPLWSTITGGGAAAVTLKCGSSKPTRAEFCEIKIQPSGTAA
jgi:hypothetical protein